VPSGRQEARAPTGVLDALDGQAYYAGLGMHDDDLWPTRPPRPGCVPELEAEAMPELRTFSREGREHELGEKLLALALHWALGFEDMVIATARPADEVARIIDEFQRHDEVCRANAARERVRRHSLAFG
jgi:hypothetical protein